MLKVRHKRLIHREECLRKGRGGDVKVMVKKVPMLSDGRPAVLFGVKVGERILFYMLLKGSYRVIEVNKGA